MLFCACVQTDEPQTEVESAAAVLANWQPLVAHDDSEQGLIPMPEYFRESTATSCKQAV